MFSAGNEDFKAAGRGWSRGHMAPAGNNKQSQDAMDQSFFLSNILPQNYDNNAGFFVSCKRDRIIIFVRDGILSVADYNSTRVGVVVVVVVVVVVIVNFFAMG